MIGIILYCLGVMYTPGPVNILSLNRGMQGQLAAHTPFCIGVGVALSFWFLMVGYVGSIVMNDTVMPIMSLFGSLFIFYLASKVIFSDVDGLFENKKKSAFKFQDGLLMQFLNPKSFLAVLPVTTVQFPAVGIEGSQIAIWSVCLGALGFGAPLTYAYVGARVTRYIENLFYIKCFNYIMGAALVFVALDLVYNHVYTALW